MRILEDMWKCYKGIIIFNVQQKRVVCRSEDIFLQADRITGFGGLNAFSSLS